MDRYFSHMLIGHLLQSKDDLKMWTDGHRVGSHKVILVMTRKSPFRGLPVISPVSYVPTDEKWTSRRIWWGNLCEMPWNLQNYWNDIGRSSGQVNQDYLKIFEGRQAVSVVSPARISNPYNPVRNIMHQLQGEKCEIYFPCIIVILFIPFCLWARSSSGNKAAASWPFG